MVAYDVLAPPASASNLLRDLSPEIKVWQAVRVYSLHDFHQQVVIRDAIGLADWGAVQLEQVLRSAQRRQKDRVAVVDPGGLFLRCRDVVRRRDPVGGD